MWSLAAGIFCSAGLFSGSMAIALSGLLHDVRLPAALALFFFGAAFACFVMEQAS